MSNPPTVPTGTVTFLFTDIEGSTKRWEAYPQQMPTALSRHDTILRAAIEGQGGYIFKTVGDAFCAAFATPSDAVHSALAAQRALRAEQWEWAEQSVEQPVEQSVGQEQLGPLTVRMGLHTGAAQAQQGDYFGQPLNRVARLLSAGHGGQVLLSMGTYEMVRDNLPSGVTLLDLGEHRLKDLIRPEHIFQLAAPNLPSEFPPLNTLDNEPNNLPLQPTPLIGREKEVAEVVALLMKEDVRLVTLTGTGGTGKTRLSLQVAADVLDSFPDGVWFVELAALVEARLVVPTIAQVLGVREAGGTPILETLREHLKNKQMLLVVDNFEQVAQAATDVSKLLATGTGVKVLVTSRIPLRVRGEREYSVPPLSLPDTRSGHLPPLERLTQYEAVRLFIERATDVKADFQVTNDNAPSVAEICVRLDGLPLAIELAAARIRLFPPQALLGRLSNRLKMLTGGSRDLSARQQTLRGTIDWSYDLLGDAEKQFFRRMAIFQGGRTLEGLEAVCNYDGHLQIDVLEGVESLVEKNLLQQREGSDGEPRFWMLETIHEYAREKLEETGEAEELKREHALYFMRLAEEAEPELTGPKQGEWLTRLEEEHDNLRAALRWARESGNGTKRAAGEGARETEVERDGEGEGREAAVEIGLRIGAAVGRFWYIRGYYGEGRERLSELLELDKVRAEKEQARDNGIDSGIVVSGERHRTNEAHRAAALNWVGNLAWLQGDYTTARALHEESLAIKRELGDKRGIANSLNNLGIVAQEQGDLATARSLYEESLAMRRELGDKWGISSSLANLGIVAREQADYATARSLYEESLAIKRELGDKMGISISLNNLGNVALEQGDLAAARSLLEESLTIDRELGDKGGISQSLGNLGIVAFEQGDYAAARSLYEESLAIRRELGDKFSIASSLHSLGIVSSDQGEYAAACSLLEESLALRREIGDKRGIAASLGNLGNVAFEQEDLATARSLHEESLAIKRELGDKRGIAASLAGLGGVEASGGKVERGARLLGAVETLLESIGAVLDREDRLPYERGVASASAQLGEEEFERLREEGRGMSMERAIEYALEERSDAS